MNTHTQAHCLSRKEIKGFAGGLALKFACSAEHYAWMAYSHQIADVYINLFTLQIEPVVFDIGQNRNLAQLCNNTLLSNISLLRPPAAIIAAELWACFGIHQYAYGKICGKICKSTFCVTLTDDRGKDWIATHVENRMLCCE